MARLFLVMCDSGEFDNAQEHVVCAYLDRELAELHVEHCTAVSARFAPPPEPGGVGGDYAAFVARLRRHWELQEAQYLEAMRDLDPEACVVSLKQGEYRVEETRLFNQVPISPQEPHA